MKEQKKIISMVTVALMLFSTVVCDLSVYADKSYEKTKEPEEVMREDELFFDESLDKSPNNFDYSTLLCDEDTFYIPEDVFNEIPRPYARDLELENGSYKTESLRSYSPVVDLSDNFPSVMDQYPQNSCTAFAIAYAKSYQEIIEHGWSPTANLSHMSPSYVYNSLNGGVDNGINLYTALNFVQQNGICSLKDMPFYETDYTTQPNTYQASKASNFKIDSYSSATTTNELKAALQEGKPGLVSTRVYTDFHLQGSNTIYDDISGSFEGYHAICVVGYNDNLQAFKFINSWGTTYGNNGYGYISYNLFENAYDGNKKICRYGALIMEDSSQHYTTKPLAIEAVNDLPVYVGSNMHTQKTENGQNVVISAGEKVIVNSIYKLFPGDSPVFKINGGYISAKLEDSIETQAFTVRFVKTDGVTGNMPDQTVIFGITSHLNQNQYSRSGYTFKGWCAKRIENDVNKFLCDVDGTTKWKTYAEIQQNNYPLHIYRDEAPLARTSPIPNDVVYMYPQWTKNN